MKGEIDFMPYKDPERKRQWEREHREQRNARRRREYLVARSKPAHDPPSDQKPKSGLKVLTGLAVGLGVVLLSAFSAINVSSFGDLSPSRGSGNSAI
jgi:hypothetical protein